MSQAMPNGYIAPPRRACPTCHAIHTPDARFCQLCGSPLTAEGLPPGSVSGLGICALIGGLLAVGAAFLPWISVTGLSSLSRNGIDGGGDGWVGVALGGVVALIELILLTGRMRGGRGLGLIEAIAAGALIAVAVVDGSEVSRRVASISNDYEQAAIGIGVYATGVAGGLVALPALGRLLLGKRA